MATAQQVDEVLAGFTESARASFGGDLASIVLFGSAAEGRRRATSDVNVIVVLKAFDAAKADGLRESLRIARAAIQLMPMFVLESEIPAAAEAFAVKFDDIKHRHRVLFGGDPFASLDVPRPARVARLRQVLLNQVLRLRERYVERSLREEQVVLVLADSAGPLRAAAATLLELEGAPAPSPREALLAVAGPGRAELMKRLSKAREQGRLDASTAVPALLELMELAKVMTERAARLT
jgi:predicted nucleotidyltransferase